MDKGKTTILGIETSCDETAASVVQFDLSAQAGGKHLYALSNAVASQVELHKLTGGVVPEVAAREHVTAIMPTIQLALNRAELTQNSNTKLHGIDAIAVTAGPGLLPALMVGVDTANALSLATDLPVVPVQHITGHIYANFVGNDQITNYKLQKNDVNEIEFPLLALIVSGGHTEFVLMKDYLNFKKIGATVDDAGGEAFDKTAKMMGLAYPGGPEISRLAEKGNPKAFDFPRPMINENNLNFSFAGLKTSVLYKIQDLKKSGKDINGKLKSDIAASTQEAIVDTLTQKTIRALEKYQPKSFTLGGGVAANRLLRERLEKILQEFPDIRYYPTQPQYATDNAAMIAAVGAVKLWKKEKLPKFTKANPRWEIEN